MWAKRWPRSQRWAIRIWIDAVFDLFLSEEQRISAIYFMMDEENIRLQLQQPWITVGTDAAGLDPAWAKPMGPYHPRA